MELDPNDGNFLLTDSCKKKKFTFDFGYFKI